MEEKKNYIKVKKKIVVVKNKQVLNVDTNSIIDEKAEVLTGNLKSETVVIEPKNDIVNEEKQVNLAIKPRVKTIVVNKSKSETKVETKVENVKQVSSPYVPQIKIKVRKKIKKVKKEKAPLTFEEKLLRKRKNIVYIRRFIIALAIIGMLLSSIAPFAYDEENRKIYFWVAVGVIIAFIVSYWIYILIYEHQEKKKKNKLEIIERKDKRKKKEKEIEYEEPEFIDLSDKR